ncbi:E3 ubiquitin-protein ligase TRIM39-like [Lissotriton helveticus]
MAAAARALRDEATCSICLDYFNDPVSIDCGHSFCRSCITDCNKGPVAAACPQCRQRIRRKPPKPNWQLRSIVEELKQQQQNVCEKHQQSLALFCEEDQAPLCAVCERSEEHRTHSVGLLEDAAAEYKVKLQDWLCRLRKEMEYILESEFKKAEHYNTMKNKVRAEKQNIASEVKDLQQLLRDNDQTLHQRLEEMEKTITVEENANIDKLSNRIISLSALITDIEKKCEKEHPLGLLKDVRSTLDRCKEVEFHGPEQMRKIKEKEIMKIQKPEDEVKKYKVIVTLDPETAHPGLLLSKRGRRAKWAERQKPPTDSTKRFTMYPCVLGSEGFTSGRHYWEVKLLLHKVGGWAVGVASESVDRKGGITGSPKGGIWAIGMEKSGQYWALTSPQTSLSPRGKPKKLGVYLDYEGGLLSLFNANSMEHLYTYPQAPFTDRLFPFFCLGEAELRLV